VRRGRSPHRRWPFQAATSGCAGIGRASSQRGRIAKPDWPDDQPRDAWRRDVGRYDAECDIPQWRGRGDGFDGTRADAPDGRSDRTAGCDAETDPAPHVCADSRADPSAHTGSDSGPHSATDGAADAAADTGTDARADAHPG
jgi:hypothetical protein